MAKKVKIVLSDIKEPDTFGGLVYDLKLSRGKSSKYFQFGEYASLELEVDEELNVKGRFLPVGK